MKTIIEVDGKKYELMHEAFLTIDMQTDTEMYTALAVCAGVGYQLWWDIRNDSEDESERCDWADPLYIRRL